MNTSTKSLATAAAAATALAGFTFAFAPAAGATASATTTFAKSFQQVCQTVGPFGQRTLGAKITGVKPTSVVHGSPFMLTNLKIGVTVPGDLNTAAAATGAKSQTVTFSIVNLNNKNITPTTYDIVKTNVTTAPVNIVAGLPSTFLAPPTGGLTAALTAGVAGTGTVRSGKVVATFQLYSGTNGTGSTIGGPQPVSCAAQNVLLTAITIT